MLAGGLVMLPFGLPSAGSTLAVDRVDPRLDLPRHDRLGRRATRPTPGCSPTRRSTLVSTYAYVNPVVAILLGVLFRNESVSVRMLVGAAIVVSSVALVVRKEPPAATQPEEGVR